MKFKDMIAGLEKARGEPLTERELMLFTKLWNAVVECVADEWSVLKDRILEMKEPMRKEEDDSKGDS